MRPIAPLALIPPCGHSCINSRSQKRGAFAHDGLAGGILARSTVCRCAVLLPLWAPIGLSKEHPNLPNSSADGPAYLYVGAGPKPMLEIAVALS